MAVATSPEAEFISIGPLAERVGVSASQIRRLEDLGVIPRSARAVGLDRRFWRADQLPAISEAIASRRRLAAAS